MPIFCPRSQFLASSSPPRQFSQKVQGTDHLLCTFWTAGFTARSPDIGSVCCIPIFQVSNRTIGCTLKRFARLYDDCMEPDHMAKYRLPMLTDLTENFIPNIYIHIFYVLTPVQLLGCFWTRLGILRSPGKFCWALIWNTIVHNLTLKVQVRALLDLSTHRDVSILRSDRAALYF
jgi:hypothetical protein